MIAKKPFTYSKTEKAPATGYIYSPLQRQQERRNLERERRRSKVRNGRAFEEGGHLFHLSEKFQELQRNKIAGSEHKQHNAEASISKSEITVSPKIVEKKQVSVDDLLAGDSVE